MKTVTLWSLFLVTTLTAFVTACQRGLEPADSASQSINEPFDFDPNREYRITAVAISGLPTKNIQIDQQKREILLDLPADFVSDNLQSTVTLTPNTTLVSGLGSDRPFGLESFCYCNASASATITPTNSTANRAVRYTIRVKPNVPLALQSPTEPISVTLAQYTSISVPVKNPYGNSPIVRAYLQPLNGGDPLLIQGNQTSDSGCVWFTCDRKQPGQLVFNIAPITGNTGAPGEYNLILEQQNGTRLTQRIRIVRGGMNVDVNRFFGYVVSKGADSFTVNGSSLFPDEVTGVLTAPDGRTWNLKPVSSAPNGSVLTMGIPANLEPGYYGLQLKQNNVAYSNCFRFSVLQSNSHPALMSVNVDTSCLKTSPVTITRSVNYSLSYLGSNPAQLKLISVADPAQTYLVPLTYPIEAFPRFNLPEAITPGTYRAVIQNNATGRSLESEPFEQPVIVQ